MTVDLERELRAAFDQATETMQPRPDLADRVRRVHAVHRRRLAVGATVAVTVLAVTAAGVARLPAHAHRDGVAVPISPPALTIQVTGGVDALAVSADVLYVATGDVPDAALTAYDRHTGRLVRSLPVPALPHALAVADAGSLWLSFYPSNHGGATGVWHLSTDLGRRSAVDVRHGTTAVATFAVAALSGDRATLGTEWGVAEVTAPLPAAGTAAGRVRQWQPRPVTATGFPVAFAPLPGGSLATLYVDDGGERPYVTAGGARWAPSKGEHVEGLVALPAGAVAAVSTDRGTRLVLLDANLHPSPLPDVDGVLSGGTAHVALLGHGATLYVGDARRLRCFRVSAPGDATAAVVPTPVSSGGPGDAPEMLAAGDDTVYVTGPGNIAAYPVPAACR